MYNSQKQTLKRLFGLKWFESNSHLTPEEAKIIIANKELEDKTARENLMKNSDLESSNIFGRYSEKLE